ncbi:MAG TPA: efflux RND transporter periplasmic adaptor subunit [Caulobacterales bacterium]|nr:efflux RND transporter periplasmic adaptor subunit [Caulobacterales bacterium]
MSLPTVPPPSTPPRLPMSQRAANLVRSVLHLPALARSWSLAQWIWIGAALLLGLFVVWMVWPRAEMVEAAVIDRGVVRHEIIDQGKTRIHDVFDVAAPVGGELQRIALEPGDAVARGAVVAVIAPADPALLDARVAAEAQANVRSAEAALNAAQSSLDLAQRDQQRVAALARQGFASAAALDSANAALRAARAQAAASRADLERARVAASSGGSRARGLTEVRSPVAGRVLQLLQQSETVVAPGSPLIEIGDPRDLDVVAEFLSQDATAMRAGAEAWIENWGGDAPIPARVERIEPYAHTKVSALGVEEQRVNVIVRLQHPESAPVLGHGFRVDVRVVTSETANAVRVPTDALVRNGDGWSVFRIVGGRARLTPIATGDGGERYRTVRSGLNVGDEVVLFPGEALKDGARVHAAQARAQTEN